MGKVIVTIRILPEKPEIDLNLIEEKGKKIINKFAEFIKSETFSIGFGIKQLNIIMLLDEDKAELLEVIENELKTIKGVANIEIIDVRRAIG